MSCESCRAAIGPHSKCASCTEPSIEELDKRKKRLRCLGCGKMIWTDRCHRFCRRCKAERQNVDRIPPPRLHGCRVPEFPLHPDAGEFDAWAESV